MDSEDLVNLLTFLFVAASVVTLIVCGLIDTNNKALASEDANQYCIERGYDTYDVFSRKALGSEAYGVKCNHVLNKQEYVGIDSALITVN